MPATTTKSSTAMNASNGQDRRRRAIVLGAGMVGSIIAADLADDPAFDVTIADMRAEALSRAQARAPRVKTVERNLADPSAVKALVREYDIVLGALSSALGFQTLRAVIDAGRNYCDISFMPENALELDDAARRAGVTAVVDCGVAPGMSNLLVGYAQSRLDDLSDVSIYVGGVPANPQPPFHYKAAFSPSDVIEEYTRPSRMVEEGHIVVREALTAIETLEFAGGLKLEAFNTDGLRTLIETVFAPCMREKTLRYPGHAALMKSFRDLGLFSHEPIEIDAPLEARSRATREVAESGQPEDSSSSEARERIRVRPIDLTRALLFPHWTYKPGEADLTVMRISVAGRRGADRVSYRWDLSDRFDERTQTTSMARTTAFPCAIVARLLASGAYASPGVRPPEFIGREPGLAQSILDQLRAAPRHVNFIETAEFPDGP